METNKPVAWIDKNTGKPRMEGFIQTDHDIPLYTHPAKEQLTDEEITELANEYLCYISHEYEVTGIYKFARAILLKAQEK